MAFAVIAATNTTNGTGATASAVVNLPTGIVSGNLLLVFHRNAVGTNAHAVSGGGWTNLFNDNSDASDDRISLWYRQADGTEGTTITITQTSSKFASLSWRITGHENPATQAPQFATLVTGTSILPDPGSLSPTGGAKDYLWLWMGGWEGEQTSPPASTPTNYANAIGADSGTGGAIATNCRVASADRALNAASEDPGSWTISVSDDWTATVVAIHPSSAPPEVLGTASINCSATTVASAVLILAAAAVITASATVAADATVVGTVLGTASISCSATVTAAGTVPVYVYSDYESYLQFDTTKYGTVTVVFEAVFRTSGPEDARVRLFDITGNGPVTDGQLQTASTTFVRSRTGALTLTGTKEYKAQSGVVSGSTTTVKSARLVVNT